MTMASIVAVLLLISSSAWNIIPAAEATLVTYPASVGNLLIAIDGQRIALNCTHEVAANAGLTSTIWNVTAPINCVAVVSHLSGSVQPTCGPLSFEGVSAMSPFTSTAIANANLSMTGAVVQCSSAADGMLVGQTTLCIVDQLPAPSNLACSNGSLINGLRITWDAVEDDSCANRDVVYNVTVFRVDGGMALLKNTTNNTIDVVDVLEPSESYNITVQAGSVNGAINDLRSSIICTTTENVSLVTTTTSEAASTATPTNTTGGTPTPTSASGPPVDIIVAVVVIILVICIIIIIIVVIVVCFLNVKGGKSSDQKKPLARTATSGEESHNMESQGYYADPSTIEREAAPDGEMYAMVDKSSKKKDIKHEEAPTGDLYAVTEKPKLGSKKGPSEDELAQMYAQPDKTRKNEGLNYASIEVSSGSGGYPAQQQMEYATVVN